MKSLFKLVFVFSLLYSQSGVFASEHFHQVLVDSRANVIPIPATGKTTVTLKEPRHGKAILIGDVVRYTPDPGYVGEDRFSTRTVDGEITIYSIEVTKHRTEIAQGKASSPSVDDSEQPNIVLIFTDDAGYIDYGFQPGADPRLTELTPRITRLGEEGAVFTNAYVSASVCGPSRAGLLTGRYQQRFGHEMNMPIGYEGGMPDEEPMISERLNPLGYVSGVVGKWGVAYRYDAWPNQRKWDYSFIHLRGQRNFWPMRTEPLVSVFIEDNQPTPESGYATDRIGDKSVEFIRNHSDKPFFLFVPFNAPHGPLQPRQEDADIVAQFENEKRGKFAGLVKALDDNVGKILDVLDEQGLTKDTLVLFINDNGGAEHLGADNGILRGAKASLYEGGIRVAWAMRWPGRIPAGHTVDAPVTALDLLPTFVKMAGGQPERAWQLDGVDILPLATGEEKTLPERDLFWRRGGSNKGHYAVRSSDWKLYINKQLKNPKWELYNLDTDIGEQNDLAEAHPEIVARLQAKLDTWESGLIDPLWNLKSFMD